MNNLYNTDSIEHLSPLQFTRLKPNVYCGQTQTSDQLLIEYIANATDETKLGHGSKYIITYSNGNQYSIRDYGQGIITNHVQEGGGTIVENAFSKINTSGKYSDDGVYQGSSLGNFGIGSKLGVYLSHHAEVTSFYNGTFEKVYFVEGEFSKRESGETTEPNGILVEWNPSEEFFKDPGINLPAIRKYLKEVACLCHDENLEIEFYVDGKKEVYKSIDGLNDLANDFVKDKEILSKRLQVHNSDSVNKIELIMTYTSNYDCTIIPYVNTGLTKEGPHITQFKSMLTREFNKFFKEKKWLKDKDANLTGADIQEGLYVVFNIITQHVKYNAQVKSTVEEIDMKPIFALVNEELQRWFINNEKDLKDICDKALLARKAREAARKARDNARQKGEKKKKALKFASKLADCNSTDRMSCEIYITEGDSATGGLKMGRNENFQAVMPVRGKILNCQKASLEQIQKNAEIMTMIEAFGLSIDLKTMKVTYNKEDLRYGKIIIMSDADVSNTAYERLFA